MEGKNLADQLEEAVSRIHVKYKNLKAEQRQYLMAERIVATLLEEESAVQIQKVQKDKSKER